MKILETTTLKAAQTLNDTAFEVYKAWMVTQGYQADESGVIGKNAKTGEDRPDAQRTVRYAEVEENEGKFHIPSFEGKPYAAEEVKLIVPHTKRDITVGRV